MKAHNAGRKQGDTVLAFIPLLINRIGENI